MTNFPHMKLHDALTDSPKYYSKMLQSILFRTESEKGESEEKVRNKSKISGRKRDGEVWNNRLSSLQQTYH